MGNAENYPKPFIRSGPNKGQIRDPLVAHEVYNTIEELRARKEKELHKRVNKKSFFQKYGSNDALTLQAAKTVREEQEAKIDNLTGLHRKEAYRALTEDKLNEIKNGNVRSVGIVRIDLDSFSWVNDNVEAHLLGDLYIAYVGRTLKETLKKNDIGIRVGGDEFVTLINDLHNEEEFEQVLARLHNVLSNNVLESTLQTLLYSDKEILDPGGYAVREGTYALRQFIKGLMDLRDNVDGRRDHFFESEKGKRKDKQEFVRRIKTEDLDRFKVYLDDKRTLAELNNEEKETRKVQESNITELAQYVFFPLGISAGGTFITRQNLKGFYPIDKKLDELVNKVKRKGGKGYEFE